MQNLSGIYTEDELYEMDSPYSTRRYEERHGTGKLADADNPRPPECDPNGADWLVNRRVMFSGAFLRAIGAYRAAHASYLLQSMTPGQVASLRRARAWEVAKAAATMHAPEEFNRMAAAYVLVTLAECAGDKGYRLSRLDAERMALDALQAIRAERE